MRAIVIVDVIVIVVVCAVLVLCNCKTLRRTNRLKCVIDCAMCYKLCEPWVIYFTKRW